MTDRIGLCFRRLKAQKERALVTFITAGDPDISTTASVMPLLEQSGADIIELGIPFSDPMADGPVIQRASERALASGITIPDILEMVRKVRPSISIPVVLMGYSNPIYSYGWERFANDAAEAGVDGLLLVDLPPEEAGELLPAASKAGLKIIFLLTPTSDESRIVLAARAGSGFLYYVTVTGVTGVRQELGINLSDNLSAIHSLSKLPVVAGFGVSTPEQAARTSASADGVVVGSAIVKLFEQYEGRRLMEEVASLVRSLKKAI
jgi:tryptophan synthase alpha chain